ncbi:hypothetical protein V1389_14810 [Flavobacterium rakeshii]|uniref:hypothetical protein n=1 Tax=Flavobacterium rakeshii TaxID=1038845 RepID=UPI002E7C2363|nr:hypothetical protein [Flavobacterium rakeshii]MEE1899617.1 hypothetical protein [Flavobacterium rakeshii]
MKKSFLLAFGLLSMGAFAQNNTPWSTTGNIGIGTTSPSTSLEVRKNYTTGFGGSVPINETLTVASFSAYMAYSSPTVLNELKLIQSRSFTNHTSKLQAYYNSAAQGFISFASNSSTSSILLGHNSSTFMRITPSGLVSIGSVSSTPAGYKLFVEDGILTEKVKVAVSGTANWADYVFADNYNLMPLNEVEAFTKENKHLPNVPSAEEMVTEGLDVAQMDAKLLEKIEELTLYLIEQNKKLEAQNIKLEKQNEQIKKLETKVEQLKEDKK